ncbi:hypothetical protein SAMN06265221_105217 [Paracoccus laeviglucosivorans]|uniref:Uncharacterized protein n=1 Tax=Paracoccus laeviglucosivorans TaxID=1197861 RepID=A0A521CWR4_9RHOB|nr:hypothetical protein SAMN06265221_105217 [Paracoccus laeviglucosivorans]
MGAPAASQAAIKRALDAAQSCGLTVTGFTVSKDGTIQVETAAAPVDSSRDNVQPLRPKQWAKR